MVNNLRMILFAFIVIFCCAEIQAWLSTRKTVRRRSPLSPKQKAEKYAIKQLTKYGYYISWVTNKAATRDAIKFFQLFNGMPVTGKFEEAVLEKLKQPRCGAGEQLVRHESDLKPYYVHGSTWQKKIVTWHWDGIKATFDEMTQGEIYRALRQAFDTWKGACTSLVFEEVDQNAKRPADITITFTDIYHRCPYRQDGKGQSFGHQFYPLNNRGMAGDIHFDNSERFTLKATNTGSAVNFLWAATHSIGHSLGLAHSHIPFTMMYPWYNSSYPVLELHKSDIDGIRFLYPGVGCDEDSVIPSITTTTTTMKTTTTTSTTTIPTSAILPDSKLGETKEATTKKVTEADNESEMTNERKITSINETIIVSENKL